MPKIADVCRHVRSKNAGPFWITVDFFFDGVEAFELHAEAEVFQPASLALALGVPVHGIKREVICDLEVVKVSYPRSSPQGGVIERDMHGGQQYVRLLNLEV